DRGRMAARNCFNLAQQTVEDIAPMGEHIEDNAAACDLAVVPARPLRRIKLAVKHPPAEIQPDRKNPAKELGIIKLPELTQSRQKHFVLHHAVLEAGARGPPCQSQRLGEGLGNRLFEVDVLAGIERGTGTLWSPTGGTGIEINRDIGVGKAGL